MRNIEDKIKKVIVESILNNLDIKIYAIYIFGSYGTSYEREDSDIDIAIITDSNISILKRYKLKEILIKALEKEVDLSILSKYDSNLMISVLSQGLLIYESDDYNIKFDEIYEDLEFDYYFMESYIEEINKYYNTNRLSLIKKDIDDCIYKLDRFNDNYNLIKENIELEKYLQESFRSYIRSFQELTIKLLANISKGLYTPKDKFRYEDIVDMHYQNNRLSSVDTDFLKELRFFRNEVAHGYEYPDFQAVYEFYNENKENFNKVSECITLLIRNTK